MLEHGKPVVVWEGLVYPAAPPYRVVMVRHSGDPQNLGLTVEERNTDAMGAPAWARVNSASNAWGDCLALAMEALHVSSKRKPPETPETWDECAFCVLTAVQWAWDPDRHEWEGVCRRHGREGLVSP